MRTLTGDGVRNAGMDGLNMVSVFDVIGPSMIGPSSSHTAGAVRLGWIARSLLGATPASALIELHGSFAATGEGLGSSVGWIMNDMLGVCLIGMAGAGKSTVGPLLAQRMGLPFVDTDALLEEYADCSLQGIVDRDGVLAFRAMEAMVVASIAPQRVVLATGGSVVYSMEAMEHMGSFLRIIWLDAAPEVLFRRLADADQRGLARMPGQGLAALIAERRPLYERYAELRVDTGVESLSDTVERLLIFTPKNKFQP